MIHGYMPRGNVNEDLYAPKGQQMAGYAVGILCVDGIWEPLPPGCVENASTFDFPVLLKVVEGIEEWEVIKPGGSEDQFSPRIQDKIIKAAKELEKQGVRAVSGACGFLANFQNGVAAALNVPVFLSSLLQITLIRQGIKPGQKIGVMTAASDLLGPGNFGAIGIDDTSDLTIVGAQDYGEFALVRATHNVGHFNPSKVERDLANLAKQLVKDNPRIGAILLECSVMPPYAWAIQNAVDLPVFDFYTLINWIYNSVVRRPFSGCY